MQLRLARLGRGGRGDFSQSSSARRARLHCAVLIVAAHLDVEGEESSVALNQRNSLLELAFLDCALRDREADETREASGRTQTNVRERFELMRRFLWPNKKSM